MRKPYVLIVDDNRVIRETLSVLFEDSFEVDAVDSGAACIDAVAKRPPDLILLDIVMTGIDGYETCRRVRQTHAHLPVIFVSGVDTLDERLLAYDSGGTDFVAKPFNPEVLLRKATRAVELYAERQRLKEETSSLQKMAMGFLQNVGETGVLLNFMRETLGCEDFRCLGTCLLKACAEYGVSSMIQIRHAHGALSMTQSGEASELESSILDSSAVMGRIFQFSNRMVVNYNNVTILVSDLPDDADIRGRIRDNVAILAESAQSMSETVVLRSESARRANMLQRASLQSMAAVGRLREMYRRQQTDTRIKLQFLTDRIEKTYVHLGLTDTQEDSLSNCVLEGSEEILALFARSDEFEREFSMILSSLSEAS